MAVWQVAQEEAQVCMGAVEWPSGAKFAYVSPYGGRTLGEAHSGDWKVLGEQGPVLEGIRSTRGVWYSIGSIELETKEEWLARRRAGRLGELGI